MPCRTIRVEFTREHDRYLVKYLAKYCPTKEGRSGQKLYKCLVADEQNRWPWAVHHTAQSWRERYVRNSDRFDAAISEYQKKHANAGSKRIVEPTSTEPKAKRVKCEERVPSSETPTEQGLIMQSTSPSPPTPTPTLKPPQRTPSPEPPSMQDSPSQRSTDATQTQVAQIRDDAPESVKFLTNGEPRSQPHATTRPPGRIKQRPRASSDVFASDPSTPRKDIVPAVPDTNSADPSEAQPTVSATRTGVEDATIPTPAAVPPRLVNTFHGQVLIDRKGNMPRLFIQEKQDTLRQEEEESTQEEIQNKARWPPVRSRASGLAKASEPARLDTHPFSQTVLLPQPERPRSPVTRVRQESDKVVSDDRSATQHIAPREAREQIITDVSSVKHDAPLSSGRFLDAPPPDLLHAIAAKWQAKKPIMFPPPRASTRSPFRAEVAPSERSRDRSLRQAQAQGQSRAQPTPRSSLKVARYPALTRLRRQTLGHEIRNGQRRERKPGHRHANVPSIDLVALSRSSMSARSHSRSSADAESVPKAQPQSKRWSFPDLISRRTKVVEDEGGTSGSGSGSSESPFPWTSEWGRDVAWTSSPLRSLAGASTSFPSLSPSALALPSFLHSLSSSPVPLSQSPSSTQLIPHAADVSLAATHGLAAMLARMSANHGMSFGVVEAVYARVGSLREADEVLKGMREAAEGWGKREIEKLGKGKGNTNASLMRSGSGKGQGRWRGREGTRLRYVVPSEDGDDSEYSPPETSQAAMWKRRWEEEEQERGEVEAEVTEGAGVEEEEGRRVEKELQEVDTDDHEVTGTGVGRDHDAQGTPSSGDLWAKRAVMDNLKALELERRVGKGRFRREFVSRLR